MMGLPMTLSKENHLVKMTTTNGAEGKRNQRQQCWGVTQGGGGPRSLCLVCFTGFYGRFNSFGRAVALATGEPDFPAPCPAF